MACWAVRLQGAVTALSILTTMVACSTKVEAAGAAYSVDTAEVSSVGSCKVESWASSASNHDFIAAIAPACVMNFYRPVEVNVQFNRARADEEWTTGASPKLKTNLIPTAIGSWGVGRGDFGNCVLRPDHARKHCAVCHRPGHAALVGGC